MTILDEFKERKIKAIQEMVIKDAIEKVIEEVKGRDEATMKASILIGEERVIKANFEFELVSAVLATLKKILKEKQNANKKRNIKCQ